MSMLSRLFSNQTIRGQEVMQSSTSETAVQVGGQSKDSEALNLLHQFTSEMEGKLTRQDNVISEMKAGEVEQKKKIEELSAENAELKNDRKIQNNVNRRLNCLLEDVENRNRDVERRNLSLICQLEDAENRNSETEKRNRSLEHQIVDVEIRNHCLKRQLEVADHRLKRQLEDVKIRNQDVKRRNRDMQEQSFMLKEEILSLKKDVKEQSDLIKENQEKLAFEHEQREEFENRCKNLQAQLDQLQKENSNFKDLTSRYGKALLQASEQPGADDKEQVVEGDGEHCAYVRDGPLLLDGLDVSLPKNLADVTVENLVEHIPAMTSEYERIGYKFGVGDCIKSLRGYQAVPQQKCLMMIEKWIDKGEDVTWEKLLTVLQSLEMRDVFLKIKKQLINY